MPVPNQFANVTTSIPLSQLDANFNTPITLGNTAIQLGNTVTTLNNMTLANVTISSGNVTITNVTVTTANVTTANIATANIATEIVTTSQTLNYGTANAVVYLNGSKVSTTGTALQFDGTNLGQGVTPSAWNNQYRFMQFSDATGPFVGGSGYSIQIGANAYINASSQWVYAGSAYASSRYQQFDGIHYFLSAGSGTAGNVITFTEALTFRKDETLALQGASRSAGTGIAFPATQNASSNANTLDDYEEVTWTPTVRGSSTAGTTTYISQLGRATKIGRLVTVNFNVAISSMTGTGALWIEGLPYQGSATSGNIGVGACLTDALDWPANMTSMTVVSTENATYMRLYGCADNIAFQQVQVENGFWTIYGSLSYVVD